MIIVVTGPKGAGKSTLLARTVHFLKDKEATVGGILSRRIWKDGQRYGYNLHILREDTVQLLAAEDQLPEEVFKFCTFSFSKKALEAGNRAIRESLGADFLIIDEIGRWELEGGAWAESLEVLALRQKPMVLGIRENVAPEAAEKWRFKIDHTIDLSRQDTEAAFTELCRILKEYIPVRHNI